MSTPGQLAAQALRSRKRPHKVVRFPAPQGEKSFQIALVVLGGDEIQEAQIAAVKHLTDEKKLDGVKLALLSPSAIVETEMDYHLLAAACRDPEEISMPLWNVEEVRSLTVDERVFLLGEYNAFARERSPITRANSEQEVIAMLAELKESGALSAWLTCCERDSLERSVIALADLLPKPTSANS